MRMTPLLHAGLLAYDVLFALLFLRPYTWGGATAGPLAIYIFAGLFVLFHILWVFRRRLGNFANAALIGLIYGAIVALAYVMFADPDWAFPMPAAVY